MRPVKSANENGDRPARWWRDSREGGDQHKERGGYGPPGVRSAAWRTETGQQKRYRSEVLQRGGHGSGAGVERKHRQGGVPAVLFTAA